MPAATLTVLMLAPAWTARQVGLPATQEHLVGWLGIAVVLGAVAVGVYALKSGRKTKPE